MSREEARKVLGLDLNRPAALVQLGTGDGDVNEKMTAALSGLLGWKDLQVILTKAPVDKDVIQTIAVSSKVTNLLGVLEASWIRPG